MSRVFFVGPLPPPVHGFSWVNSQVYDLVCRKSEVIHFDRNPKSKNLFKKILGFLIVLGRFLFSLMVARPTMVYIGWSGGLSMLVDFLYVVLSKSFGVSVCLHHHSFAYLNRVRWFNRIAFSLTRNEFHVVLCGLMADLLVVNYGVKVENVSIVSNAAFLPVPSEDEFKKSNVFSIGFLSNITEAKGIFEFFDLAERFSNSSSFKFLIAGPVADEISVVFSNRLLRAKNVVHVGSVYAADKADYLNSLDVFIFPTKYVNEAEPVSISEAMRVGLPVISISRGCISEMLRGSGVVTSPDQFLEDASGYILRMASDFDFYKEERRKSIRCFKDLRLDSLHNLESLIDRLVGERG